MTRAHRPGFRFSQGQLYISTDQHQMRLGTWPLLEATRRHKDSTEWQRFVPVFRLLRPKADFLPIEVGPEGLRSRAVDPLLEKYQAFRLFRQAIPPLIALAADALGSRTQLAGHSRVSGFDEPVTDDGDEPLTLGDVLASDAEDPSTTAARNLDWQAFMATLDERALAVLRCLADEVRLLEVATAHGVSRSVAEVAEQAHGPRARVHGGGCAAGAATGTRLAGIAPGLPGTARLPRGTAAGVAGREEAAAQPSLYLPAPLPA